MASEQGYLETRRRELQTKLEEILGTRNVYYQPPEDVNIKYPCIIYYLRDIPTVKADNIVYKYDGQYTITLVHTKSTNNIKDALIKAFPTIKFNRSYISDGLHHFVYNIIY